MVSTRLPTVQRPTRAPAQSRLPVRAPNTSVMAGRSTAATLGGTVSRKPLTASMPACVSPRICATAAATMKKGNSATSVR